MKLKSLSRSMEFRAEAVDAKTRTFRLSFSSETPVDRWFGTEILDHDPKSVRLARLNAGAPLLFNHNVDDIIGVVERAEIGKDKRGYAEVRVARTPRGDEILGMVEDQVLRNVSTMYRIHEIAEKPKENEYRALDWEPYEISIVSTPADFSVGIGRADAQEEREVLTRSITHPAVSATPKEGIMPEVAAAAPAGATAEIEVIDNETGKKLEKARVSTLARLGEQYKIDQAQVRKWIDGDTTVNAAGDEIVRILEERGKIESKSPAALGMSRREVQGYSLMRAINACADKSWGKAPLELEAHREIQKRLGTMADDRKFYVPLDVQNSPVTQVGAIAAGLQRAGFDPATAIAMARSSMAQRDLTVASASAGGYLVGTDNQGFIELLRNRSVCFRMGARRLSGLQGSVTVPRQTAAGTAVWLANEASTATESTQTLGQLALSPKTVGAYTEISRQLTLQSSPDAESMVMADLAAVVALAVDLAGLEGSGASGQPTGISNTAGIGAVTGTTLAYAGILEFQTDVASANVMPVRGGYVTTPAVAALLMGRARFSNTDTPLWVGNVWDGVVSGFPSMSSNQLTAASMIFGDWEKLVIGEWGVLEVEVNPYANFQAGIIGVRAMYSVDVGVRYPAAYSRSTSIT